MERDPCAGCPMDRGTWRGRKISVYRCFLGFCPIPFAAKSSAISVRFLRGCTALGFFLLSFIYPSYFTAAGWGRLPVLGLSTLAKTLWVLSKWF